MKTREELKIENQGMRRAQRAKSAVSKKKHSLKNPNTAKIYKSQKNMRDSNRDLRKVSNPQEQEDSEQSTPLPLHESSNPSLVHASSSSTWHFDFIRKRLQSETPISREERKKVKDWAFSLLLERTDEKKCEFGASKRDTVLS